MIYAETSILTAQYIDTITIFGPFLTLSDQHGMTICITDLYY